MSSTLGRAVRGALLIYAVGFVLLALDRSTVRAASSFPVPVKEALEEAYRLPRLARLEVRKML